MADWLAEANHGLRKDFEDKVVLFPFFDAASIGLSIEDDKLIDIVDKVNFANFDAILVGGSILSDEKYLNRPSACIEDIIISFVLSLDSSSTSMNSNGPE